jgi:RsiW-degrading membrane proteinase PrsW (M82 family)
MEEFWVPLLLVAVSALPAVVLALWFHLVRYPLRALWFLFFLAGGALSILPAALIRSLFPFTDATRAFIRLFVGTALSEEAGRLVFLIPLLLLCFRFLPAPYEGGAGFYPRKSLAAAAGSVAGLGFALMETATYSGANIALVLLRDFTSALLHASCACRVAVAVEGFRRSPFPAVVSFIMAVALHGVYDLMVLSRGMPPLFPVLLVMAISVRTVQMLNTKEDEGSITS